MQFKTKDLLVTVLPRAEIANAELARVCLLWTVICKNPTVINCGHPSLCVGGTLSPCGPCSVLVSVCRNPTIINCGYPSLCYGGSVGCGNCSLLGSIGCGFLNSCGPGGSACDPTIFCPGGSRDPFVIQHLEDLVALKAELQATLKSLDAIQKEGLPSSVGSKTDAEALERGLTEALEQVRSAKKNL